MDDVPILDRDRLELITRGDAALAQEFLAGLFQESNELIERLVTLLGSNERLAFADAAHTLKGMAMELGAMRLRAAAAALETEAEPAHWSASVEHVRVALAELYALVNP